MVQRRKRRSGLVLAITAMALGAVGLTCRKPEPPLDPREHHPPPMPFDNRHRMPYALPKEPPPPPAPPAPPHPELADLPPRTGAPGSTTGTIACGAARCFAPREACTWIVQAAAWGCVPVAEIPPGSLTSYACDDTSDCTDGMTCCRTLDPSTDHVLCAAPGGECRARVCAEGDGAACPAGQICRNAVCVPAKPPPATCDGKKACPADRPICFWEDTEGECVSEAKAAELAKARDGEGGIALRRCTRPADCGAGFRCCDTPDDGLWMSACALQCGSEYKIDYCDTAADCGVTPDVTFECKKARASGQAEMPPWSKRCQPAEELAEGPVPGPKSAPAPAPPAKSGKPRSP